MPRDSAIIFGDQIGKFDMLRFHCAKCGRAGRHRLADLITPYGPHEKLFAFTDDVTANCMRKQARTRSMRRPVSGFSHSAMTEPDRIAARSRSRSGLLLLDSARSTY